MNHSLSSYLRVLPGLCLALAVSGCGGHPERTYPVTGVVRLDGKPLALGDGYVGTVLFATAPEEGKKSYTARGRIGPDGTYRLTTFEPDDGAVAGRHRVAVVVSVLAASATEGGSAPKPLIPTRYNSGATSGLEIQVPAANNQVDLDLNSTE